MNENIKEIVNIIGNAELSNKCHSDCFINTDFDNECSLCRQATALVKAGYRKQEDTVKEFAEKLKDGLDRKCRDHGATNMRILQTQANLLYKAYQLIEDLAEQYGKEEK